MDEIERALRVKNGLSLVEDENRDPYFTVEHDGTDLMPYRHRVWVWEKRYLHDRGEENFVWTEKRGLSNVNSSTLFWAKHKARKEIRKLKRRNKVVSMQGIVYSSKPETEP